MNENPANLRPAKRLNRTAFLLSMFVLTLICSVATVIGGREFLRRHYMRQFNTLALNLTSELESGVLHDRLLGVTRSCGIVVSEVEDAVRKAGYIDNPDLLVKLNRVKSQFGVKIVYVMNRQGTVVACTPYGEKGQSTLTGRRYDFRPYFQRALKGEDNVYPAVGVTTLERGLYYASPIYDSADHEIIGVCVLKRGLDRVDSFLKRIDTPAALVSPDGHVFSTNVDDWMFQHKKVAPKGDPAIRKYVGGMGRLPFSLDAKSAIVGGREHLLRTVNISLYDEAGQWKMVYLSDTSKWYSFWMLVFFVIPVILASAVIIQFLLHRDRCVAVKLEKDKLREESNRVLRLSESKYKDLIERTDTGYVIMDETGRVVEANQEYLRLAGAESFETIEGRLTSEWTTEYDQQLSRELILNCLKDKYVRNLEVDYQGAGDQINTVEINAALIGSGDSNRIVAVCRDITERRLFESSLRENEERWRLFTQHVPSAIQGYDANGVVFYWNRASAQMYGYTTDEAIGSRLDDLIMPEKHKRLFEEGLETARDTTASGEFIPPLELMFQHKDGSLLPVYSTNTAVVLPGKEPALFSMQLDMSDQRRAEELEESVRRRTAELEAVNQELEAFCYSVSHDLRAPLRGIDGFSLAVLEDNRDSLDETSIGHLERVRRGAQKMSDLIDDLLNLSRLTREKMVFKDVNLTRLAEEVIQQLRISDPDREIETKVDPDMILHNADESLIQNVLQNLIANAWKFTGKTADAKVHVGNLQEGDRTIYFVKDNGAGFNMDYVDNLFGAFQRLHSQDEFEGTGIGLASSKRIIHRHGGEIWAESEDGEGATFYFTLE